MFYFIPSWYNQERQWYDTTTIWSRVYDKMEFDDTINQLKMFQEAKEKNALLVLAYRPQLRYFLHKQDLQATPYWSFFDDIQNITRKNTQKLDFKALNWPEQTTFLYSPFIVLARRKEQTLARIYFAENGNLLSIDTEENGQITQTFVFDDRGFLSSSLFYKSGKPHHQDYYNEQGVWQVRESLVGDGAIQINEEADKSFAKQRYTSWEELLRERLAVFSQKILTKEDTFVIASDERHNALLVETFKPYAKIFSFFGGRFDMSHKKELASVLSHTQLVITEKEETKSLIEASIRELSKKKGRGKKAQKKKQVFQAPSVLVSTPFDSRLRLGHSQSQKELEIYLFIDTISPKERQELLEKIISLMETNQDIHLTLGTYDRSIDAKAYKADIDNLIYDRYDPSLFFTSLSDSGENQIDDSEEEDNKRIKVQVITSETQIISLLDHTRLVIDLGVEPDLYTQIASISAGIPQINSVKTEYVTHLKNGWILTEPKDVTKAIHYYFDGLRNWNDALVYAVEKMGDYTSGKLLARWKEELKTIAHE
ncbi:accessory Sec system protein Asp1 [Streptococcus sp. zg-JUN1979]|uniref:accessory Sec system protein Asp1 n=1 Tax=Streptococcus sp. zg-JUN1979 TaxID=3391450 RepID=UPI0039A71F40